MKNAILVNGLDFQLATNEVLFSRFAGGKSQTFRDSSGMIEVGTIQSISREDGSGYSWNVTVTDSNDLRFTFHLRTTK